MTISAQPVPTTYACASTTGPYSFPYRILLNSDLAVTRINAAGVRALLTLTTDYTVSGAGSSSGANVTTTLAYADGHLELWISIPDTQGTAYSANGPFPAASHEAALDKLTLIAAQDREVIGRALVRPRGETDYDTRGLKVTGLADGVNPTDAVTREQYDALHDAFVAGATVSSTVFASKAALAATVVDAGLPLVFIPNLGTWVAGAAHVVAELNTASHLGAKNFVYAPSERGTNALAVTCTGDGVVGGSRAFTGTDSKVGFRALMYASTYLFKGVAFVPAGKFLTSETIDVGYGDQFTTATLEGDGACSRGEAGKGGTAILCAHWGAGINVQGARNSRVKDLTLCSLNWNDLETRGVGTNTGNTVDQIVLANWLASAAPSVASSRYAPHVGLAIDGASGTAQSDHYADKTFANGSGVSGQYSKQPSNNVSVSHVTITGFAVGVVTQPGDFDANGDSIYFDQVVVEYAQIAFSIGQGQMRNLALRDCIITQCHTGLTNSVHGKRIGFLSGSVENTQISNCVQWFDIGYGPGAGPLTWLGCYSESLWRLGRIIGPGGSFNAPVKLQSCQANFDMQNNGTVHANGFPVHNLEVGLPGLLMVEGCGFNDYQSVFSVSGVGAQHSWKGNRFNPSSPDGTLSGARPNAYQRRFHNATCGGLVESDRPASFEGGFASFDLVAGTEGPVATPSNLSPGGRALNACVWSASATPKNSPNAAPSPMPPVYGSYDKADAGTIVSAVLAGLELVVTFNAAVTPAKRLQSGAVNGGALRDFETGFVCLIHSVTGDVVTATLQNGYRYNGTVYTYFAVSGADIAPTTSPFVGNVGTLQVMNCGYFVPSYELWGDFTSGNPVATNVGRPDGYFGFSAEIQAGDALYIDTTRSPIFAAAADAIVSSVNGGANTITFAGNATATKTRVPLGVWIMAPPANHAP